MGRPTVWVLLGLTLLAVSLHEVQVGAEVGPSESECRPYIEKAIHNLKSNDFVEDDNESTENDVSLDTGTSSEDENVVSEESDGGEVNSNEDTTVDETTNDHTHEETNEDDQSKEEQGSAENEEMTDGVDESFEQADQPIVESNDSNENHEEKSEEETENSKQESEEDHTEESEEHHESEEEHTVNVSGEETEEQEEAISVEETGTDDESKEVEDENKTEEHDDNIASEETTEGDQTDNGSEEHSAEESHEKQDSAETDGSEEKKDDSVEDTTETHDDATEFEAEDDVSNEAQETENESGEVHEAVEKVEASRVGRSLPEEEDDTESTEHKEEDNDSKEEEHTTEEEHDSDESKPEEESVEAHGEESHEEEAHDEKSHEEESHEDKSHEDESHEEKSHEEEETHSEESHEEETHSEESHEDEAHVEKSHEDESHENKSHEEESHEDKSHEDESHEKDAHGEDAKSEEEHSHEKEGSAHEDDASKEEAHADEASTEEAHEDEASTEEAHEEEVVKREVHVDERTNPGEHSEEAIEEEEAHTDDTQKDSKEHEDPHPEEDLLMEYDVPTNLRDRSHIAELLHLDDDSVSKENAIQKSADVILRDLKRIYENAIKPLETLYKYRDLSNRHFGDPEIFSKPLVLFMGPWSGGKSTILNYLTGNEYTPDSLRTGAEPSPAYFNILMHGDEPEVLDGTQLAADWTFSGLQKFGQGLEDRLRGLKLPSKLLEKVNIVEIPGILEVRKQVSRLFPFNDACQWFIDRADIIFLVYDPSKLDVGPETEAILDQLKGREYQTRIILNKGDQVKPEELMRVQGALIWNISPLMSSAQPPVMYTTSLWSNPYEVGAPIRLLQAQERAFLRDLRNAIEKRIENKISSARRFAVRVRNHAKMVDCYLTTYYNHKSLFANRKQISDQIIEHPQNYHIYEGLSTLTNISRYDLPDPEVYRDFFRLNSLYEFKKLSETCTYFRGCPINKLDIAIAYDLPELVGKYKKSVETAFHALENESNKGKS